MANYITEREGQIDFYNNYIKVVDKTVTIEEVLADNNDGVLNGNILEFKLCINDLNSVLFQTIKYLSSRRLKGKPIPANIILISLNDQKAYLYKSIDYLKEIETLYIGASSKDNSGFIASHPNKIMNYVTDQLDEMALIDLLKSNFYTKINIDENCIVGWAKWYYQLNPNARKADFLGDNESKVKIIGEIRKPSVFKDYINPYNQKTNTKFQYLMDKLNDDIQKKNLGAFYTPLQYVEKSIELVRDAIKRVPEGNDYIILDRCAGTGNLESLLSEDELSHTIVSTIEYYEYKVLLELLGDKVRHIIPPTEKDDTFNMGLVRGADALSEEYIRTPIIKQYLDNPKCTIILFENPPYAETTSLEHQRQNKGKESSVWKNSFVVQKMKNEVKGAATNDLGNAFIWSAFKYYLRQDTDSYIVYSPVKYWKAQHLINKEFLGGFAFNRKHFHTNTEACVSCIYWGNKESDLNNFNLQSFDIKENVLFQGKDLPIKRLYSLYSQHYYEKSTFKTLYENGILIGLNGLEASDDVKKRIKPIYSEEMLGYLVADSVGFDNPDAKSSLLVAGRYNGNGFYLRKDNYLEKLPMFCASRYITYNREWTERARIMKSADGADRFLIDIKNGKLEQYLLKCLLFTCLEMQNHMRSLIGSDNRYYRNELCLDNSNGETIACRDIKNLQLNNEEEILLSQWNLILKNAKETKNYNPKLTYGMYQISVELDTYVQDVESGLKMYDYPELHGNIKTMKELIKKYYNREIVPMLFEYELLK